MPVTSTHTLHGKRSPQWMRCRDAYEGTDAVKAGGEKYLPKLGKQDADEYKAYVLRGFWYGATGRTVQGLTGSVMRVPPQLKAPEQLQTQLEDVTMTGTPLASFAQMLVTELLTTGRAGLLLDLPKDTPVGTVARPYWILFLAEAILNWRMETLNGVPTITLVVLQEQYQQDNPKDPFQAKTLPQYRVLKLVDGVYQQELWRRDLVEGNEQGDVKLQEVIFPKLRGTPITYIPFVFVNPQSLDADPDKPPLLDMIDLNLSHYRNCADLEHGRHFTALPTPYITGVAKDTVLKIGSSTAWAIPQAEARIGMLEFTGQGLKALEVACETKERQMAVLGARMLEEQKLGVEAAETLSIRNSGEHSTLASIAGTGSQALTKVARWHAEWIAVRGTPDEIEVKLNSDFHASQMDPSTLTALMAALQGGGISYETFYWNLERGEMTRPGVDAETEKTLIDAQTPEPITLEDEPGGPPKAPGEEGEETEEDKAGAREPGGRPAFPPKKPAPAKA